MRKLYIWSVTLEILAEISGNSIQVCLSDVLCQTLNLPYALFGRIVQIYSILYNQHRKANVSRSATFDTATPRLFQLTTNGLGKPTHDCIYCARFDRTSHPRRHVCGRTWRFCGCVSWSLVPRKWLGSSKGEGKIMGCRFHLRRHCINR